MLALFWIWNNTSNPKLVIYWNLKSSPNNSPLWRIYAVRVRATRSGVFILLFINKRQRKLPILNLLNYWSVQRDWGIRLQHDLCMAMFVLLHRFEFYLPHEIDPNQKSAWGGLLNTPHSHCVFAIYSLKHLLKLSFSFSLHVIQDFSADFN